MKHSILFQVGQHFPAMCPSFTRQKFSIVCTGIKKYFSSQTKACDWKVLPYLEWNAMFYVLKFILVVLTTIPVCKPVATHFPY